MNMDENAKERGSEIWLFADSKCLPIQGIFIDCEMKNSKQGTPFPAITLEATDGKYVFSRWRCDCSEVKKHLNTSESDLWKGKLMEVATNGKCLLMRCIEQEIK
jgi:hypothetical protein